MLRQGKLQQVKIWKAGHARLVGFGDIQRAVLKPAPDTWFLGRRQLAMNELSSGVIMAENPQGLGRAGPGRERGIDAGGLGPVLPAWASLITPAHTCSPPPTSIPEFLRVPPPPALFIQP